MWEKVKLDNYVSILSGFAFKSTLFTDDSNHIPIIRIRDIKRSYTDTFYTGSYKEEYIIKSGDFIIGMDGEFNIAEWKGIPSLLNQRVCKISTLDKSILSERYLFYIISIYLKKIEDKTSFVTVKHLSVKDIKEIEIPFPPLHIQEKIAKILDKADELRRKDQELQNKYDQLAQAIFIDMFGDPVKNEKGWEVRKLDEVCSKILGGGTPSKSNNSFYENGTIPWVTPKDMKREIINNSIDKITEEAISKSSVKIIPKNSLLMVIRSGILKRKLPVAINSEEVTVNQDMKAFIFNKEVNLYFMLHYFYAVESSILSKVRAVTADNIEFSEIKKLNTIIPPIHLQEEFAQKIEIINQLKAQTNADRSEELFQSLLQKAFKGELVS